jgi:hypothetical protein
MLAAVTLLAVSILTMVWVFATYIIMKIQVSCGVKSYQLVKRHNILQNISNYLYHSPVKHSWNPISASKLWDPQISATDMISVSWDVKNRGQIQVLFWHAGTCTLRYCRCWTCKCPASCLSVCKDLQMGYVNYWNYLPPLHICMHL